MPSYNFESKRISKYFEKDSPADAEKEDRLKKQVQKDLLKIIREQEEKSKDVAGKSERDHLMENFEVLNKINEGLHFYSEVSLADANDSIHSHSYRWWA